MENTPPTVVDEILANGLRLTVTDDSRPLAGDRWLVRLVCRLHLSPEKSRQLLSRLHPEILATECGNHLAHEGVMQNLVRERNFITEQDVAAARGELLRYLTGPFLRYLQADVYPLRMLSKRVKEWEGNDWHGSEPGDADEEESGPADFSHLFR